MTTLHIDHTVLSGYPEVVIALVVAEGVAGADSWPAAERALTALEASVADGSWAPSTEDDPPIAVWHAIYRRFGTNPRRVRPSVDALCRRLARTGQLPRVNGPVDAYNAVSVRHGLPAGAFDLDAVRGDLHLRLARDGDVFTPLGEPETTEQPRPGEVVYADDFSVLTRHWNHRDAERTKVTSNVENVLFLLEGVPGAVGQSTLDEAAQALTALVAPQAKRVTRHLLGAAHATAEVSVRARA
ncbi:B3/B4 domain-containing protein (DNA/RNA-binding domain of Phe-tRNA-synthetase) [Micromonospora nigra]|uniref:B3/B4 domain-containing protein (DNA/RNA-binding domain of Phe-tRNA-synthetase) n=1 Tax=Micromonospora nigra TaxID=145857 RepID=A0A1C6T468_9ACTN|nr:phenylalanine--tRNA ligase beta subunit-related protein [Micromonospora nigra]SCL36429.1 B3/B4 domain-containing protein (DNA/RNA-binding domain of Phe-tRNA-synthetase) [Micromonospora nigra]